MNRDISINLDSFQEDMINANENFRKKKNSSFIDNVLTDRMKNDISNTGIDYIFNYENFRSENFIENHEEHHILFAGCSNTFGEGIEYEKTWAKRLYKEILKRESVSGYFNLGTSGASVFEILTNVNRYIRKYSMPNTIFLLLPELERDARFFTKPEISLTTIVAEMYNQLEYLCKQSKTTLISTSWVNMDEEYVADLYSKESGRGLDVKTRNNKYPDTGFYKFLSGINPYMELKLLEDYTNTFKVLYKKDIVDSIHEYSLLHKEKDIFVAKDSGGHHGEGFHYAWFKYFYERYKNEKIDI